MNATKATTTGTRNAPVARAAVADWPCTADHTVADNHGNKTYPRTGASE